MARKIAYVTIDADGRDKGKVFVLHEMNADQGERWAMRLLFALMNAGVEVPDGIESAGMAGIAAVGIKALGKLPFAAAEPLLAEMFECVQIQPSPNVVRAIMTADDIEEIATRVTLRKEIFKLHVDFFTTAAPLTPASASAAAPAST